MELMQKADIVSFEIMGQEVVQLNHPDLIKHVLVDNHKNYRKSKPYIRFESALGLGLLTSNGEKWKHDRQKIQPMFNREKIAGLYYDIVNEVTERHKQRWLAMTDNKTADINLNAAMEEITTEVILRSIYGNEIDDEMVSSLHHSYDVLIEYLGTLRLFPRIDLRKLFCMPSYFRFKKALQDIDSRLKILMSQYKKEGANQPRNLLELLMEAHFSEQDVRDHCVSMVFAGFETTSTLMKWFWYAIDDQSTVKTKLLQDIARHAPCTQTFDTSKLSFSDVQNMNYLDLTIMEILRLYPPFWISGREPIEDDYLGGFKVKKGTAVALPQIAMHRHPNWWKEPNSFLPERFLPESAAGFEKGMYFPFSLGPRGCSGQAFSEMEAKTTIAKLLPFFEVSVLNKLGNAVNPGITLRFKHPLRARISRRQGKEGIAAQSERAYATQ